MELCTYNLENIDFFVLDERKQLGGDNMMKIYFVLLQSST